MRGASSLLYSLPRRGPLNDVPTLPNRSTACFGSGTLGQEARSEPLSPPLQSHSHNTLGSDKGLAPQAARSPPVLLLEGDELFLSDHGIARTYYEIVSRADDDKMWNSAQRLALEEHYDLKRAKKTFTLRRSFPDVQHPFGIKVIGSSLMRLDIEEIDHGVLGAAGTGATTWEASIAMSLFWSTHADLLLGNVIELGSGVGLGGILSGLIGATSLESNMTAITLTDHNQEVLSQCRENVLKSQQAATEQLHRNTSYSVAHLDWYDVLTNSECCTAYREKFDTVIASDCAYRYEDLVALACTMKELLKPKRSSKIHFFGPFNRGALHDLLGLLESQDLEVSIEEVDVQRYRLQPEEKWQNTKGRDHNIQNADMSVVASQATSKFLHVTAFHKTNNLSESSMADID